MKVKTVSCAFAILAIALLAACDSNHVSPQPPATNAACRFPVWKTIRTGKRISSADARSLPQPPPTFVNDKARELVESISNAPHAESEVSLVNVSVGQLGFSKAAGREEIYSRARTQGLDLLSAEEVAGVRLGYNNQPKGEWLFVAIAPVGSVRYLVMTPQGLLGYGEDAINSWEPESHFVFACR